MHRLSKPRLWSVLAAVSHSSLPCSYNNWCVHQEFRSINPVEWRYHRWYDVICLRLLGHEYWWYWDGQGMQASLSLTANHQHQSWTAHDHIVLLDVGTSLQIQVIVPSVFGRPGDDWRVRSTQTSLIYLDKGHMNASLVVLLLLNRESIYLSLSVLSPSTSTRLK